MTFILYLILLPIYSLELFDNPENLNKNENHYIEFLLKNGEVYFDSQAIVTDNRLKTIDSIFYHHCDSLITNEIIPSNCRYLKYIFVIDTLETSENVSKFINEIKERQLSAYFTTNRRNDFRYTKLRLPIPEIIKDSSPSIDCMSSNKFELLGSKFKRVLLQN